MSFESFSFDQRISAGISACGYETPTPIQSQTIPSILRGEDLLGLAQTGTGKTAAFALPILQHLINSDAGRRGPVRVLVLAPTRELALQIQETFVSLGKQTGFRSASVFGGVGIVPQIKAMRSSSIIVACPGRLLDLASRKECDLSQVDVLVLDEADRMFDMGFLPDLRRILAMLPTKRQNLMFSATMPGEIRSLANEILHNPVTVQVNHTQPKTSIKHVAYNVPSRQKTSMLQALLKETDHESVLVFTRTKHRAKNVARLLGEKGWQATALQGNLSQNRRQEALDGFRAGRYKIMVATDIAARGIDCTSISHVINYDVPDTAETYTHRIGRTGRADRTGTAMTLISGEDTSLMRSIERMLGSEISRLKLDTFVFDPSQADEQESDRPRGRGFGGGRSGGGFKSGGNYGGSRDSKPGFGRDSRDSREARDSRGGRDGERSFGRKPERAGEQSSDRDFGRTVDRQRNGARSPYSDQLSSDRPRFERAAKPALGGADRPAYAKAAKPWRKDGEGSTGEAPKRFERSERFERSDRFERTERPAGERRDDRSERPARFGRSTQESRAGRTEGRARAASTDGRDRFGKPEKSDRSGSFDRREGFKSADRREGFKPADRQERSDKPAAHRKGESFAKADSGSAPFRKRREDGDTVAPKRTRPGYR